MITDMPKVFLFVYLRSCGLENLVIWSPKREVKEITEVADNF
jgi:hypothetical protein